MSHVYEKADYTAAYSVALRMPSGARLQNYRGPEFPGTLEGTEPPVTVRVHYHPITQRPTAEWRADLILAKYNIGPGDNVCVFGSGFGWLCEALIAKTGCNAVGVDLSQYVQDAKDTSANDELIESIQAGGLDHTTGHGKIVYDAFQDPAPRTTSIVVQGDVKNTQVRNEIRKQLGNNNPNIVITEEVWQILTSQEQQDYQAALESWVGVNTGGLVIHVIEGVVI